MCESVLHHWNNFLKLCNCCSVSAAHTPAAANRSYIDPKQDDCTIRFVCITNWLWTEFVQRLLGSSEKHSDTALFVNIFSLFSSSMGYYHRARVMPSMDFSREGFEWFQRKARFCSRHPNLLNIFFQSSSYKKRIKAHRSRRAIFKLRIRDSYFLKKSELKYQNF